MSDTTDTTAATRASGASDTSTQIYRVFIKAAPERIWQAITSPDDSVHYFHGGRITNTADEHTSTGPDGSDWGGGAVLEFDPPRRLSYEWVSAYDPDAGDEPPSRVTWELEPAEGGITLVTLTHDRLERSPKTAEGVSGAGWMFVLSGLKTYLETGEELVAAT
jgi:uncharacterized protein YndB with AHSA1/START domain